MHFGRWHIVWWTNISHHVDRLKLWLWVGGHPCIYYRMSIWGYWNQAAPKPTTQGITRASNPPPPKKKRKPTEILWILFTSSSKKRNSLCDSTCLSVHTSTHLQSQIQTSVYRRIPKWNGATRFLNKRLYCICFPGLNITSVQQRRLFPLPFAGIRSSPPLF